jgi:hypothetical protein
MNAQQSPTGRLPWALYSTYFRVVVCLFLLPLLVTGFVLLPPARSDFVATILIVMCCLFIDRDTVARSARARPNSAG